MSRFCFTLVFLLAALPVQARPISYPGGWTVMTENNDEQNSVLMHYTLTPRISLGYRIAYDRDSSGVFHGIQMNNLVQRWNNADSQANIYLLSALGIDQETLDPEGFMGVQADWETRRFMMSYENMAMASSNAERREFHQQAGFGIAPYVAESGSLHSWLMLHVIHEAEDRRNVQLAPMLRLFKGDMLVEAGYNVMKNTPVVNAVIRF